MSPETLDLTAEIARARGAARAAYCGRVARVAGVLVEAEGLPAAVGDLCRIERQDNSVGKPYLLAEVVGLRGHVACLMPYGDTQGIAAGARVVALDRRLDARTGDALLGRVLDGFGVPIDGRGPLHPTTPVAVEREAPAPLHREPITALLQTGVRCIDGCLSIGRGQRIGIFAGSGVGKSTLLSDVVRGAAIDVAVVVLVGERGREVRSFIEESLGPSGLDKSVVVVSTSDRPPLERYKAPFVGTAIAESFRDRGRNVLLVMDSLTRFATACREIGLAAGEPPTVKGYPPSFFATVPRLVERAGTSAAGAITAFYTVLLDGDDLDDPVGDTLRGLLDGHFVLSRKLANRGHYPAIDLLASVSRLMPKITAPSHRAAAQVLRELLSLYEENRDLVQIGAYKPGTHPRLDKAIERIGAIESFLRQESGTTCGLADCLDALARCVA